VTPEELEAVEAQIRKINRFATIHRTQRSAVAITDVLNKGAFDLNRVLAFQPDFLSGDDDHEHNEEISSMSFELDTPIDPEKFNAWIGALLQDKGPDLLRTKGILSYANEDRRFAFQAVHMIADGDFVAPWKEGEPRVSRIVFIGRNLNRPQLRRGFQGCAAA
jgi:G3E family GTPase